MHNELSMNCIICLFAHVTQTVSNKHYSKDLCKATNNQNTLSLPPLSCIEGYIYNAELVNLNISRIYHEIPSSVPAISFNQHVILTQLEEISFTVL